MNQHIRLTKLQKLMRGSDRWRRQSTRSKKKNNMQRQNSRFKRSRSIST